MATRRQPIRPFLRVDVLALAALLLWSPGCGSSRSGPPTAERQAWLNREKHRAADLVAAGSYEEALRALAPLADAASGDAQILVLTAKADAGLGRFDDAVANYTQAVRVDYSSYEAHLGLATILMKHQKIGRALTEFELAVQFGPRVPLTHYNYGLALRDLGRRDEAVDQLRQAFELAPNDPRYAEALGIGLSGVDDKKALGLFERAHELGAKGASFQDNYGLALQHAGRYEEAAGCFRRAIAADSTKEEYRFNLAAVTMRAGDYERAAKEWKTLIDRFGGRWSYRVYLGRALVELGRGDEAVEVLDPMTRDLASGRLDRHSKLVDRMPPDLAEAYDVLGLAYRAAGNLSRARSCAKEAVDRAPSNPSFLNNYGVILAESGMVEKAKAQWRRVLEIDADNATAKANLSKFAP